MLISEALNMFQERFLKDKQLSKLLPSLGDQPPSLPSLANKRILLDKDMKTPPPLGVKWKVLNRG